ncbi:MAG TPA: peptide chain release factor N(5)-glutamine methyltransferase [Pyrinomonadaceae bacterium]|jgi:release factor glutamine methyltransferase
MNITETLKKATEILHESGLAEPRREANSLLAFALGKDRTFLITRSNYELSQAEEIKFQAILKRRAQREPLQYITGRQEFYGLDFRVSRDVLIPRPETEIIVENSIEILKTLENSRFCEIGVGSGCISVAILHNVESASAVGLDVAEKALEIARANAENHRVSERFDLKISNVFDALKDEKFDLIVSNPPYIPRAKIAGLQVEVRDYEPLNALTDGDDGLSIIEKIAAGAPAYLNPDGFLLMEIGFGQAADVKGLFDRKIWRVFEILPDLQGIPRTVRAQVF